MHPSQPAGSVHAAPHHEVFVTTGGDQILVMGPAHGYDLSPQVSQRLVEPELPKRSGQEGQRSASGGDAGGDTGGAQADSPRRPAEVALRPGSELGGAQAGRRPAAGGDSGGAQADLPPHPAEPAPRSGGEFGDAQDAGLAAPPAGALGIAPDRQRAASDGEASGADTDSPLHHEDVEPALLSGDAYLDSDLSRPGSPVPARPSAGGPLRRSRVMSSTHVVSGMDRELEAKMRRRSEALSRSEVDHSDADAGTPRSKHIADLRHGQTNDMGNLDPGLKKRFSERQAKINAGDGSTMQAVDASLEERRRRSSAHIPVIDGQLSEVLAKRRQKAEAGTGSPGDRSVM